MRLAVRSLSVALALGLVPAAMGCAKTIPHVTQGLPYSTGQGTYDDFFNALHELEAESKKARDDEAATHDALIKVLGLESKSTGSLAVGEAEAHAKKLRDAGIFFHVELVPEAKVVTAKAKGPVNVEAEDLAKAVEESARGALMVGRRLGTIATRAADLEKIRTDLRAQAPATFRGEPQARRDEITAELDAAATVISETADNGDRWAGLASKFALELARAMETGGGVLPQDSRLARSNVPVPPKAPVSAVTPPVSPPPAAPTAPKPATPPPAAPPPKPVAKPAAPPPAAPPPPKKKKPAKGGDDFEP